MKARHVQRLVMGGALSFALFAAYWFIGRSIVAENFKANVAAATAAGYDVQHRGLSVTGFPFQFKTHIAQPAGVHRAERTTASTALSPVIESVRGDRLYYRALSILPLRWRFYHRGDARFDMRDALGQRWLFDIRPFKLDGRAVLTFAGGLKSLHVAGSRWQFLPVIGTPPPLRSLDTVTVSAVPQGADIAFTFKLENLFMAQKISPDIQAAFGPKIDEVTLALDAIGLKRLDAKAIDYWLPTATIRSEGNTVHWGLLKLQMACELTASNASNTLSTATPIPRFNGWIKLGLKDERATLRVFVAAGIITERQAQQYGLALSLAPENADGYKEVTLSVKDNAAQFLGQTLFEL